MLNKVHQQIGVFMIDLNKYEKEEYDSYTKEQIYEAFISEYHARLKLNKEVNELRRVIAKIKFDMKRIASD